MSLRYTLTEGNDALNKTLLMMRYDVSKTLNENLVSEQTQNNKNSFFLQNQPSGKKPLNKKGIIPGVEPLPYVSIQSSTISEGLLKAREYLFTTWGMTAQIVISILGSEIGAPIAFIILDIAIIINDFSIMVKNWKETEYKPWTLEWFSFHWENNKGFQMVIEDLLLLLGSVATRLVGKSSKSVWKYLKSMSKNTEELVLLAEKEIIKKEPLIKKLPKKLADFSERKLGELKKGLELLKSPKQVTKSVVRNTPKAIAMGGLNFGFLTFFDRYILPKLSGKDNEITELIENINDDGLIDEIIYENPELFPNGIKSFQIVTNKQKKFVKFIIDGQNYGIKQKDTFKLKKLS
jgi:hypothetical protein